jgi:hypothetical protein
MDEQEQLYIIRVRYEGGEVRNMGTYDFHGISGATTKLYKLGDAKRVARRYAKDFEENCVRWPGFGQKYGRPTYEIRPVQVTIGNPIEY